MADSRMLDTKIVQLTEQVSQLANDVKTLVEVNQAQQVQFNHMIRQRDQMTEQVTKMAADIKTLVEVNQAQLAHQARNKNENTFKEFDRILKLILDSLQWTQFHCKNMNTKLDIMEYRQCQASPMPSDAQRMVDQEASGSKWGEYPRMLPPDGARDCGWQVLPRLI